MTKIAIISSPEYRSPRILAESLNQFIKHTNTTSEIFYQIKVFKRLLTYQEIKHKHKYLLWISYKLLHFIQDKLFLKKLRKYDAIIICEATPAGFMKDNLGIEILRKKMGEIPIIYYEVFYLGNAPNQIKYLKSIDAPLTERYDWHLSVSDVTEIKTKPSTPWSHIGIFLKSTGLQPAQKKGIMAIIDFPHPGFKEYRSIQIQALEELNIPYITLKGNYTFYEIRKIYSEGTFYFMQSNESFGLPIAECLSTGCYIFTPDSSWPMSWRLDKHPQVHAPGTLPRCFVVYNNKEDLKSKLKQILEDYDLKNTPQKVFNIFYKYYPAFFEGNMKVIRDILHKIEIKKLH